MDERVAELMTWLDADGEKDPEAPRIIALAFAPDHDRATCEVCVPWEEELARLRALDAEKGDVPRPRRQSEVQPWLDSRQAMQFLARQRWSADAVHRKALVDLGVIDVADSASAHVDLGYELDGVGRRSAG